MIKRIIFLDIDGVLNSEEFAIWCFDTEEGKQFLSSGGHHFVDPSKVTMIKDICNKYNVRIVISSSWKTYNIQKTIEYFNTYRDLRPLTNYIVGITPWINDVRGREIEYFINHRNYPPKDNWYNFCDYDYFKLSKYDEFKYCIIDDDTDMLDNQLANFVHIDNAVGLTENDCDNIINILK